MKKEGIKSMKISKMLLLITIIITFIIFICITGSGYWSYILLPIIFGILNYAILRNNVN